MTRKARILVALGASCIAMSACVPYPLLPKDNVSSAETNINSLMEKSARRSEVVAALGRPNRETPDRETKNEISYLVCQTAGGIGVLDFYGALIFVGQECGICEFRGDGDCFELILEFDSNDRLAGYRKTAFNGEYTVQNGVKIGVIQSMAEKGFPESQWRLYDESGRKTEDAIWLCRSADNGYAKAQLHVGHQYWGADNITKNRAKAYVWYKLASTGNNLHGLLPDTKTQEAAEDYMKYAAKILGQESLSEADSLYTKWKPGQCEVELLPEDFGN